MIWLYTAQIKVTHIEREKSYRKHRWCVSREYHITIELPLLARVRRWMPRDSRTRFLSFRRDSPEGGFPLKYYFTIWNETLKGFKLIVLIFGFGEKMVWHGQSVLIRMDIEIRCQNWCGSSPFGAQKEFDLLRILWKT